MKHTHADPRPTRPRTRALPRWSLAAFVLAALLLAACADSPDCNKPRYEFLSIGTTALAAADPCAGQPENHVVAWYTRGGVRYPLRCGKTNPAGYGYRHVLHDEGGHGDAVNDTDFSTEIAYTLEHGVEGFVGGGNYRYTREYSEGGKGCTNAWGFRVVLAKLPLMPDGHPAGIITALRYSSKPTVYP